MRKGIILRTSLMTVLSLSLLGLSQETHAVPAYDASAALSGSRTVESGLTGTGPFDHHEASGILWDITEDEGQYHYNYTLFGFSFGGGSAINQLTLDISDLCSATAGCLLNVRLNGQPIGSFLQFSAHRRYLRQPVWGNVFIQGEDGGGANTGLDNHGIETIQDFIARPDTQTSAVPEPASLLRLPLG
jgi:hypothetical protein